MFYLGCFYLWGNIDVYVLSYFHEFNPDLSYGFIFIVDTLLITANTIGYNIGSFLMQRLRLAPKVVVGFGGGFALTGVFLSSYTKKLGPYLSLYTGMNGLGCGMCYMVPLICAWEYFPEKKGMMTGIIIGAYGFGSFIFSLLSSHLVNPNKENPTINGGDIIYFSPDVANRVPYMIRVLSYIWTGFVLIAVILITRKPANRVKTANIISKAHGDTGATRYELTAVKYCFLTKRFW